MAATTRPTHHEVLSFLIYRLHPLPSTKLDFPTEYLCTFSVLTVHFLTLPPRERREGTLRQAHPTGDFRTSQSAAFARTLMAGNHLAKIAFCLTVPAEATCYELVAILLADRGVVSLSLFPPAHKEPYSLSPSLLPPSPSHRPDNPWRHWVPGARCVNLLGAAVGI